MVPTVNIADAVGWPMNGKPKAAAGLAVGAFASGLDHPRWLYTLPNGDVLVAETNAPPKPEDKDGGIRGMFIEDGDEGAGAGTPSANRITLLRDADGDGVPRRERCFIEGLNSPFGMTLVGDTLYVANTDAVVRFPYRTGETAHQRRRRQGGRPAGRPDQPSLDQEHDRQPRTAASCMRRSAPTAMWRENGIETERRPRGDTGDRPGERRIAALCVGLAQSRTAWHGSRRPASLWTVVNERDEIGSDLVPDYMTSVKEGGFYGWPYSYFGQTVDTGSSRSGRKWSSKAIKPDYALGPHTASLGLVFYQGDLLPKRYVNGAFIGQHGSWNRKPRSGYKVVFVPFDKGKPAGEHRRHLDRLRQRRRRCARPAGRRDGRSRPARCWWRTMSAT